jgi:hypothetical protein
MAEKTLRVDASVATPTSYSATGPTWIDPKSPVEDMDQVTQSEIAGMWNEAKAEFERITGKKLGAGRSVPFGEVSALIEARQQEEFDSLEEKDKDGWERARSIGDKLATCAKVLIGLAQQVAPYVSRRRALSFLSFSFLFFRCCLVSFISSVLVLPILTLWTTDGSRRGASGRPVRQCAGNAH